MRCSLLWWEAVEIFVGWVCTKTPRFLVRFHHFLMLSQYWFYMASVVFNRRLLWYVVFSSPGSKRRGSQPNNLLSKPGSTDHTFPGCSPLCSVIPLPQAFEPLADHPNQLNISFVCCRRREPQKNTNRTFSNLRSLFSQWGKQFLGLRDRSLEGRGGEWRKLAILAHGGKYRRHWRVIRLRLERG